MSREELTGTGAGGSAAVGGDVVRGLVGGAGTITVEEMSSKTRG